MSKRAGILFPVSALPSPFGVGDFGKSAYQLIDELSSSHIKIWQILPLNPLGYGNSPYQPLSSHAGDEIYIDLMDMVNDGLLKEEEFNHQYKDDRFCQYQKVKEYKDSLYKLAFSRFRGNDEYIQFKKDQEYWLKDYAIYRVFKSQNDEKSWTEWEDEYKYYIQDNSFSLNLFLKDIEYHMFLQYYFYKQWDALREYAHQHSIEIIGDMPIYVGLDSVDVYHNQESFLIEEDGTPSFVAGVPPDYFSKYGQRWGNPIYDWDYLKKNNFSFWVERIKAANELYDKIRIDHFRAFDTYWKIPESETTAIIGEWIEAPGYELFDTLYKEIPNLSLLAEDLGDMRDEVYQLRDHYNLKGMYVFQFHYQHDFDFNKVVVYSGTHDNDTLVGWLDTLSNEEYKTLKVTLEKYEEKDDYQKIIHYCLDLDADDVIIPVWDIMGLDTSCRFNVPGKIGSPNWEYRLVSFDLLDTYLKDYSRMIESSHRNEG